MLLDVLARQARDRADHAFLLHEGRRVSFREFDRLANRAANRLVALGVVPGDRVTLGLGNSIEYVAAAFGILKAGGVLHPINPGAGPRRDRVHPRACCTARRRPCRDRR